MNTTKIYTALRAAGMTAAGACGVMGNLQAESAMKSNNAQDGMTILSDEDYTAAADSGQIDFIYDSVGYGLAQWTFWSRKKALIDFAHSRGVSVGDAAMQIDFLVQELQTEYPAVWSLLCSTDDVYSAAAKVCTDYERPAVSNIEYRASAASDYLAALGNLDYTAICPEDPESPIGSSADNGGIAITNETIYHLQSILVTYGYNIGTSSNPTGIDGYIGKKTVSALKDFVSRLEALL